MNNVTIIVNSAETNTADFHIVQGVLEVLRQKKKTVKVQVIEPSKTNQTGSGHIYAAQHHDFPKHFFYEFCDESSMTAAHLASVELADLVITIGGSFATKVTGLAALGAGKPVLPISCFGGASRELLNKFSCECQRETKCAGS